MEMDGLNIIDNNTGNKWTLEPAGRGQFNLRRIYSSKKNKRRQQQELVFSESYCLGCIQRGAWSIV